MPGQAGAGTGCLPSSQRSSRGVGSAQASQGLLGWPWALAGAGDLEGVAPHKNCLGVEQVMLVLGPGAQDSAEGCEGSGPAHTSSSLQPVTVSPCPQAQPKCTSPGKPSLTTQAECFFLPVRVLGTQDPRTDHQTQAVMGRGYLRAHRMFLCSPVSPAAAGTWAERPA